MGGVRFGFFAFKLKLQVVKFLMVNVMSYGKLGYVHCKLNAWRKMLVNSSAAK